MKKQRMLVSVLLLVLLVAGCGTKNQDVDVTLGDYKGIEVSVETNPVTDDDINNYAEWSLYNYNQSAVSSRDIVEDGDIVQAAVYFYDADGSPLDDGTGHEDFIHIGSHSTYEELEQGIIGAKTGDTLEIPVTLPDPYLYDESLSGKQVSCKVTINYIQETEKVTLDTITDEQAKVIFGVDDVDNIKETIQKELEKQRESTIKIDTYNAICEKLLEICEVNQFPEYKLTSRLEEQMKQVEETCTSYYGMSFSEYCELTGMTREEYQEDIKTYLMDAIKLEQIITAIGDMENISYDEAEFSAYLDSVVAEYGYETAEELYEEYGEEYVQTSCYIEHVMNWLIENVKITYVTAGDSYD